MRAKQHLLSSLTTKTDLFVQQAAASTRKTLLPESKVSQHYDSSDAERLLTLAYVALFVYIG